MPNPIAKTPKNRPSEIPTLKLVFWVIGVSLGVAVAEEVPDAGVLAAVDVRDAELVGGVDDLVRDAGVEELAADTREVDVAVRAEFPMIVTACPAATEKVPFPEAQSQIPCIIG